MTHSGGKPHRDFGQRYEIWCKDRDDKDMLVGYSDSAGAFKNMIELHSEWHSRRVVDRVMGTSGAVSSQKEPS